MCAEENKLDKNEQSFETNPQVPESQHVVVASEEFILLQRIPSNDSCGSFRLQRKQKITLRSEFMFDAGLKRNKQSS